MSYIYGLMLEMLEIILIYLLVGMISGFLSGALGIGSGVLLVPALAFIFTREHLASPTIVMHLSVGTSLAVIAVMTSRALWSRLKEKTVFGDVYRRIAPGVCIGTVFGVLLAHHLESSTLMLVFGLVVFLLGLKMFFIVPVKYRALPNTWLCSTVGFVIGAKSGLLGLGGGALSTPFLTHFGVPLRRSVLVANAISVTVSIVGAISAMLTGWHALGLPHQSIGYVYWPAALFLMISGLLFAPVGVEVSQCLPVKTLRYVLAIFLLVVGMHMLYHVLKF